MPPARRTWQTARVNATTNKAEPASLEYFTHAADFGSLLPWMTQDKRFEPSEQRASSTVEDAFHSDVPEDEHELTLAACHLSERLLRQFFDDSPISMAVFDPTGRLLHVNRAFGAMLEYAPEVLMKRNIDELVHPNDVPSLQKRRRMLLEEKCDVFEIEARFCTASRGEVWTRICGRREPRGDRPSHIFAHIVDFTELERMLESFRRDADEARWMSWDPDRYMD